MNDIPVKRSGASPAGAFVLGCMMFGGFAGAEFASGDQTTGYFLNLGGMGVLIGPLVIAVLTFISSYMNFEISRRWRPATYIENSNILWRSRLARRIFAALREILFILFTVAGIALMSIVVGNAFGKISGIPPAAAGIIFLAVSVVLAAAGRKALGAAGIVLSAVILASLAAAVFPSFGTVWPKTQMWIAAQGSTQAAAGGIYAMIALTCMYLAAANPIVPAASEMITSKRDSVLSAAVHMILSFAGSVMVTVYLAGLMPGAAMEEYPVLYAMQTTGAGSVLFAVLVTACVLSTSAVLLYGVAERWARVFSRRNGSGRTAFTVKIVTAVIFAVIAFIVGMAGNEDSLQHFLRTLSMIGFPVLVLPCYFLYPYRAKGDKRRGWLDEKGEWKEEGNPQESQYAYGP